VITWECVSVVLASKQLMCFYNLVLQNCRQSLYVAWKRWTTRGCFITRAEYILYIVPPTNRQVPVLFAYWHWSHSIRSRVYERSGVRLSFCLSVRPSVRLSHNSPAACTSLAGDIDRLLHGRRSAAATPLHGAQQCHVDSWRRLVQSVNELWPQSHCQLDPSNMCLHWPWLWRSPINADMKCCWTFGTVSCEFQCVKLLPESLVNGYLSS